MDAIRVTDVSKTYRLRTRGIPTLKGTVLDVILGRHRRRQFQALDGLSFSVAPGETVGVIGANGAGKSTLLGVLAGTIFPSGGEVKIDGRVSPLLELGAGFHQDLTGRENVFLNGSVLGLKRKQIAAAFDRIVDFAGLHGFMDTPVKFYSSGMYVRLGFSVAVEVDPDVLLVDEVLAVGDEAFQLKCYARMEEFQAKGKTILIVSHDLDAIQRLCSRVILLQDGKAAAEGKPDEVIPAYRRAAAEAARPTKSEETGSREIAYTAVRFLDAGGREKDEFFSGEKLVIELDYEAREKTADPVFGFAVRDAEGRLLFGTNTSLEKAATGEAAGRGRVRLEIEPLPLLTGEYLFSFAIHSPDHWRQYHRLENAKRIRVANPEATEGLYRLPCRFTIGPKGE